MVFPSTRAPKISSPGRAPIVCIQMLFSYSILSSFCACVAASSLVVFSFTDKLIFETFNPLCLFNFMI
jgi:hypothetical protein